MVDISVIFVSFNTKYFLEQAISSVIKSQGKFSIELFVVDNHSSDNSLDYIQSNIEYPIITIQNESNLGFATANNIGIQQAKGKYILLLNPDTVIQADTLATCYHFAETHQNVGAIGVKMVDGSGNYLLESKRAVPTPANSFWKLSGISNLFPKSKIFSNYNLGNLDEDLDAKIEVLCGAFMFAPRKILMEVEGFDEDYFMYGEDIDLSYKIKKAGYDNWYLGTHTIIHYKGQSTKKSSVDYVHNFYNAMSIFAKKHYASSGFLISILSIGIWLRQVSSIIRQVFDRLLFVLLEAVVFAFGFFQIKDLWAEYQFGDSNYYGSSYITYNIFIYVSICILVLNLLRSYKNYGNRWLYFAGVFIGLVIILIIYSLLPIPYRSSRAIILFGALWILISGWMLRTVYTYFTDKASKVHKRIGIVGNKIEYNRAKSIVEATLGLEIYTHHIPVVPNQSGKVIAEQKFHQLDELVFCLQDVSLESVLEIMAKKIQGISFKLFGDKSITIIGSRKSNELGEIYGLDINYKISDDNNSYFKRLMDILCSIILLILYPILVFLSSYRRHLNPLVLMKVIFGKYTLIGYNEKDKRVGDLPEIKKAVIANNDSQNSDRANQLNTAYALHYTPWGDVVLLFQTIL